MTWSKKLTREEYEDLYRKAWEKQVRRDLAANPKLKGAKFQEAENDIEPSKRQLSKDAKIVNGFLERGLRMSEIGTLMDKSIQTIGQIRARYDLPRKKMNDDI